MVLRSGVPAGARINGLRGYLIALSATAVALGSTVPLHQVFGRFPYLPLLLGAVIISASTGGLGPGVAAAGGGAIVAEFLGMRGLSSLVRDPGLLAEFGICVVVAAVVASERGCLTATRCMKHVTA